MCLSLRSRIVRWWSSIKKTILCWNLVDTSCFPLHENIICNSITAMPVAQEGHVSWHKKRFLQTSFFWGEGSVNQGNISRKCLLTNRGTLSIVVIHQPRQRQRQNAADSLGRWHNFILRFNIITALLTEELHHLTYWVLTHRQSSQNVIEFRHSGKRFGPGWPRWREKGRVTEWKAHIKKHSDTVKVTLKRAGPDTEQLKEERPPWRQTELDWHGAQKTRNWGRLSVCETARESGNEGAN